MTIEELISLVDGWKSMPEPKPALLEFLNISYEELVSLIVAWSNKVWEETKKKMLYGDNYE